MGRDRTTSRSRPTPVIVAERARETPDDPAIVFLDEDRTISWRDLDERSRLWAAALRRQGVQGGDFVLTMMPNTPEASFVWLGISWLRAAEVPINPDYRGDWLVHAVNTPRCKVLVISHDFAHQVLTAAREFEHVEKIIVYDHRPGWDERELAQRFEVVCDDEFFTDIEPATDLEAPNEWDLWCVIYTSGTTGRAKPVLLPWGQQEIVQLAFSAPEFHEGVFYGFWPAFHALGKAMLMVPAMLGGHLVLRSRFSTTDFWTDIRENGCTNAFVVSVIAGFLHGMPEQEDDADNPLRAVVMAPVLPDVDDFKKRFDVQVYTFFGSTEVGGVVYSLPREVTSDNAASCGRALPDSPLEIALFDEHDYPVPDGVPGELVVRPKRPWVMNLGYLNMPEASQAAWRNGWFHTGDLFVRDVSGEYYFKDRTKDYIRRRGENISSFEVEAAVTSTDGIAQAAAVAVPADDAEDEIMVFVVPEDGATIDPGRLLGELESRMPRFALPRYIEVLRALPATQATFRVQKHRLREAGVGPHTYDRLEVRG
jgi:crotonobetaine/carnitine-CoA ligase